MYDWVLMMISTWIVGLCKRVFTGQNTNMVHLSLYETIVNKLMLPNHLLSGKDLTSSMIFIPCRNIHTTDMKSQYIGLYLTKDHSSSHRILLWSHGNCEELTTTMVEQLERLSQELSIRIAVYDYSGYGLSPGKPSEQQMQINIVAVVDHLRHQQYTMNEILPLGYSIGTGVTSWLAAEYPDKFKKIILVSSFRSIGHIVSPKYGIPDRLNFFHTENAIKRWFSSDHNPHLFLLHGSRDTVTAIEHCKALYEMDTKRTSLFIDEEADHETILRRSNGRRHLRSIIHQWVKEE